MLFLGFTLLFGIAPFVLFTNAYSVEPVGCEINSQCANDYYCDVHTYKCRACFSCEELKRKPPLDFSSCVKTISVCGVCIDGYTLDRTGASDRACVAEEVDYSTYLWVALAIFIILILVSIFFILRRWHSMEFIKSFGNFASSRRCAPAQAPPPSAPAMPPPPYSHHQHYDTELHPFIDRYPVIKSYPTELGPGESEGAGFQGANVFNGPRYDNTLLYDYGDENNDDRTTPRGAETCIVDADADPRGVRPRSVEPRSVEPRSVEPRSLEPRGVVLRDQPALYANTTGVLVPAGTMARRGSNNSDPGHVADSSRVTAPQPPGINIHITSMVLQHNGNGAPATNLRALPYPERERYSDED